MSIILLTSPDTSYALRPGMSVSFVCQDTGDPPTLPLKGVGGSQKASGASGSCGMPPPTASEACVDNQDSLSTECDSDGACSSHSQTTTNTHGRSGTGLDDRSLTASPIRDPLQAPTTDSCKPAGAGGGGGEILDYDANGPSSSSCSSTAASRRSRHSLSQHFLLNCKGVGLGMGELGDIHADGRDEDGGTSSGDDGHAAVGGASFPLTPPGGNGSVKTAQQGVQATAPLAGAAGRKGKEGGGGGKGGSGKGDEGDDKGGGTNTSASASASASAAAPKGGGASVANMQIKTNHAANGNPSLGACASASASAAAAAAMPPPRATRLTEPDYRRITYYSNRVKTALGRVLAHQATLRAGAQTGGGGGGGEEGGGGANAAAAAPAAPAGGGGDCGGKGKGGKAKKGDK